MAQEVVERQRVKVPAYLRISKVIAYIMYVWVYIGIALLFLRMFLLAFSASTAAPFVQFVYRTSADYLAPFRGIFPPKQVSETGYFDVAALFAIVIYLLLAWAVSALISYIQYRIDKEAARQRQELAYAATHKQEETYEYESEEHKQHQQQHDHEQEYHQAPHTLRRVQ